MSTEFPSDYYPKLDLLTPDLDLEKRGTEYWVKDQIRKQWLLLTPEEWVRQHAVYWMINKVGFPATLISLEKNVRGMSKKRFDIVGFGPSGQPLLLVECKAPLEKITAETARQALQYNQKINAQIVWLTNGMMHKVLQKVGSKGQFNLISTIPDFKKLIK